MPSHAGTPYLEVVDEPRQMKGKGAPRSTVFGVLGRTKESPRMKTLGGLVERAPTRPIPKGTVLHHASHLMTERHITGPAAKTHVPGHHYAQIPYPGVYMSEMGKELS